MLSRSEKQGIVEFCAIHIVNQGKPAWNGISCEYINGDGERCFIGAMLTEEQARKAEDSIAAGCNGEGPDIGPEGMCKMGWNGWTSDDLAFLDDLQDAHDRAAEFTYGQGSGECFFDELCVRLESFCTRFGLRFPEEYI